MMPRILSATSRREAQSIVHPNVFRTRHRGGDMMSLLTQWMARFTVVSGRFSPSMPKRSRVSTIRQLQYSIQPSLCAVSSSFPCSTTLLLSSRSFGSKKKDNKQQKQEKPISKAAKRKQKRKKKGSEKYHREHNNREHDRIVKLKRQRHLHPAAKMKRVLSAADFWFSKGNLEKDTFMREQLLAHKGYIPLTVLLTFPRFEYWTDLPLLYDAFTNPAAHRFQVIIDKKLIKDGQATLKHDEREERERAIKKKIRKKINAKRAELRQQRREKRYHDRLEKLVEVKRPEILKEVNESIDKERAEIMVAKRAEYAKQEYSVRGFLEKQRDNSSATAAILGAWEKFDNVEEKWDLPDYYKIDDVNLDELVRERLEESHSRYLWEDDDDEWQDEFNMELRKMGLSEEPLVENDEASAMDYLGSEANDADNIPQSTDIRYALVRHKRVSLAFVRTMETMDGVGDNVYDDDDDDTNADANDSTISRGNKTKQKASSNMQNYSTNRNVVLISTPKKLANFCERLKSNLQRASLLNNGDPDASAIGFDVEYCTLELDIRSTLPAMLQLAGPTADSQVGLIWLDKFPDHGRGMLADESARPLVNLLSDASILKVGVGAPKDAIHLAAWWGITDRDYVGDFIAGAIDLADEVDDDDERGESKEKSLASLCEAVLERRLPKRKAKRSYANKQRKRRGLKTPTAHWRVPQSHITAEMKDYAANDAASGIDIWMKLKGLQQVSQL
eukprot:scaffold1168_cov167-Amphora_coffeaeformis.AAC.31